MGKGDASLSLLPLGLLKSHSTHIDNMYPTGYTWFMIEIRKTDVYVQWLDGLRDIPRSCAG